MSTSSPKETESMGNGYRCSKCGHHFHLSFQHIVVYAIGTIVMLAPDITGVITGISISHRDHFCYKVTWMNGGSRKEEWFESFEIKAIDRSDAPIRYIGFLSENLE
jgi:hypothetical protein